MSCTPWMPWLYMISAGSWDGPNDHVGVVSSTMIGSLVRDRTAADSSDGE